MNGKNEANRWALIAPVLAGLAALGVLVAGALTFAGGGPGGGDARSTLALALRGLPLEARSALHGDAASFDALAADFRRASTARRAAGGGEADWRALSTSVAAVESARPAVQTIGEAARQVRERAPQLLSRLGDLASTGGAGPLAGAGAHLDRFQVTVQRLQLDVDALASGVGRTGPTAQRLADGLETLDTLARGLTGGRTRNTAAAGANAAAAAAFVQSNGLFSAAVRTAIGAAAPVAKAQSAVAALSRSADALAGQAGVVRGAGAGGLGVRRLAVIVALAIALSCLGALVWVYRNAVDRRREAEMRARENDRNQDAIMRLLDELSNLADGDLTVQATVTEDITGAIADSVNYTVEELRNLVGQVQSSAEQVRTASAQAQTTSTDLLKASEQQLAEIRATGRSVLEMAERINAVSAQAQQSSDVARQSLRAAEQGQLAVRNSIDGMNAIRSQIQDTSKRIKRLGESSQEIGEITELISDLTEQTNVLALNAAIQAASAGDAGRGFSVVAEEVQRLAERSADAAKQIAALVRAIQTDTQDAVAAMEKSTQGVVEGARLSDSAGTALSEIDRVSRELAELIQRIAGQAQTEAQSANHVAENIQHIFVVTEQTGEGTRSTAELIAELARVAGTLRDSVTRFKIS